MFDSYGLYRYHHALCLRKQCRAPLARTTFAKVSPLARVNFGDPLQVRSSTNKHRPYRQAPRDWDIIPRDVFFPRPSIRDVLFHSRPDSDPVIRLRTGSLSDRFRHVKTMHQLFIVLKPAVFILSSLWEAKERDRHLISLGELIAATTIIQIMQANTVNTFNYASELPEFTRIFRLFVLTALPVPRILMFHGLKAAACGNSPTAMMHYLLLYHQQLKVDPAYKLRLEQWSMIVKCILITTRPLSNRSETTLRQKKAWTEVVTYGLEETSVDIYSSEEEILGRAGFSMYNILIEFGVPGLSKYFRLVERFCESLTIFEKGMSYLVLGRYDRNLSPAILNFIFNSYVQILIATNSPEHAWKLAQKALPEFGAIQDTTWKFLFRHPEFLTEWKPGWEKPVMVALERYLSEAERELGVKWIEGEDGFLHMPREDEPERELGVKWIEGEDGFLHMPREDEPDQQ